MGADDDVGRRPSASSLQRLLLLLGGPESGEHLDLDRVVGQPLGEGAPVLLRQNRRRHQDRDLLASLHRLEGGAHRDFGLAVAHVAHQQPVHGQRALHVALDVLGGLPLVRGVLVEEAALQLPLPAGIRRERESGGDRAPGVEVQQLGGHLFDRLAGPLPHPLPGGAAQPVDPRRRPFAVLARRPIPLELVEPIERHVEPVAAFVLHDRHLDGGLADHDRLDAAIDPDAVIEMDHVVADGERPRSRCDGAAWR